MHRTLSFVVAGLIACSAAIIVVTSGGLPERVATHFAFDGRANGWMSRDAYAWMMGILALALPFGLTFGLLPYLPLPAQTSLAFGAPITWPDIDPDQAEDPVVLAHTYNEVAARMQTILDALYLDRVPFIGQPQARRVAVERLVVAPRRT